MVVDSVQAPSKLAYGHALYQIFAFAAGRPLTRALLQAWRSSMDTLSPQTVNVRLSAVRKLVTEARKNGMLSAEEAQTLNDVPNVRQQGTRLGNWLTKEQAKQLLAVPDRATLKGKRDYCILALLVGCALRRRELASLDVGEIQLRENRWVIADLCGKGNRVRTVAVPVWSSMPSTPGRLPRHRGRAAAKEYSQGRQGGRLAERLGGLGCGCARLRGRLGSRTSGP